MRRYQRILATFICAIVFVFAMASTAYAVNGDFGSKVEDDSKAAESFSKPPEKYSIPATGTLVPKSDKREDSSSIFWKYGFAAFVLDYKHSFNINEQAKDVVEDCDISWSNFIPGKGAMKVAECAKSSLGFGVSAAQQSADWTKYLDISFYINTYNTMLWWNYIVVAFSFVKFISWAFTLEIITIMLDAYKQAMLSLEETLWKPFMYLMWAVAIAWMVYYWISGKSTKLWSTLMNSLIIIALSATLFTNLPTFLQAVSNASTNVSVTILSGLVNQNHDAELNGATAKNHRQVALNVMEDNMSGILLDLPYILINFGSPALANAIGIDNVLKHGTNGEERNKALSRAYNSFDEDGRNQMKWLTAEKAPQRLANSVVIMIFAAACGICFCIIAALTIIWQFIALGRGLLAAIYLVIGLWPEYGMKEFFLWLWSMIQALFMKVFYTIILAIYIIMVVALASKVDEMGFLLLWLLAIGMFIGLMIALKELREKLTSIPFGNGVFGKGATNDAEQVLEKFKSAGEKALGYGTAVAGMAAGNPMIAKAGLAMAKKGVSGAIQSTAHDAISSGADKLKARREERKSNKEAERAYEDRVNGLDPEDARLANHVRDLTGIDVTTPEGQAMLGKVAPDYAKNNKAALDRIGENTLAREMAKQMPRNAPVPGSLEHEMLSRRFGEDNVNLWNEAQGQVNGRLQQWNSLSPEQKANTPKPRTDQAAVQKQFEKLQTGNRLNREVDKMRKDHIGDQVYANFTQMRQQYKNAAGNQFHDSFKQVRQQSKNVLGDKIYSDFKKQVEKSGELVVDLNQLSRNVSGITSSKPLEVKFRGDFKSALTNNPEVSMKNIESIPKQIEDHVKATGGVDKMNQPITVEVNMPVGEGGTFGTTKTNVTVEKINTGGSSGASLDPEVLRNQIRDILATASRESTIPTPGKIKLDQLNPAVLGDNSQVIRSAEKVMSSLQKQLNFVSSNSDAGIDAFSPVSELNKFMKKEFDSFEKQIRHIQKEFGLQANRMATEMESFQADVKDVMKAIDKIKKDAVKGHNPPTPPSGGGGSAKK